MRKSELKTLNKTFINKLFYFYVMPKKIVKKTVKKDTITKDMAIGEAVSKHPETIPVFLRNGLHCIGCAVANFENIEQGARAHGIDIDRLMKELNEAVAKSKKK
jgi:hybrid cluster-associated redox disulfide protein